MQRIVEVASSFAAYVRSLVGCICIHVAGSLGASSSRHVLRASLAWLVTQS